MIEHGSPGMDRLALATRPVAGRSRAAGPGPGAGSASARSSKAARSSLPAGDDPVAGEGGQVGQQRPEAVDRQGLGGAVEAVLGEGPRRASRWRDRIGPRRRCLVAEQQRCPGRLEVPAHVGREEAQEEVAAHPVLAASGGSAGPRARRLERPEVALHARQALVGEDHARRVEAAPRPRWCARRRARRGRPPRRWRRPSRDR